MPIFGSAGQGPAIMRTELMRKLTVSSAGGDVRKTLKSFGLGMSKAGGTVIVKVCNGKVEGSAWKLLGGAGKAAALLRSPALNCS